MYRSIVLFRQFCVSAVLLSIPPLLVVAIISGHHREKAVAIRIAVGGDDIHACILAASHQS
jgi:hypothetical protein